MLLFSYSLFLYSFQALVFRGPSRTEYRWLEVLAFEDLELRLVFVIEFGVEDIGFSKLHQNMSSVYVV